MAARGRSVFTLSRSPRRHGDLVVDARPVEPGRLALGPVVPELLVHHEAPSRRAPVLLLEFTCVDRTLVDFVRPPRRRPDGTVRDRDLVALLEIREMRLLAHVHGIHRRVQRPDVALVRDPRTMGVVVPPAAP